MGTRGASRARFEVGDALRGFAALGVALFHAAFFGLAEITTSTSLATMFSDAYGEPVAGAVESLEVALYVFFALSGYLIARPFVGWLLHERQRPRLRRYALHRLLRVVPPFWAAIVLVLVFYGLQGSTWSDVAALALFLQVYEPSAVEYQVGQAWSLSVELGFYVVLPLAAFAAAPALRRLPRRWAIATLLAGLALVFVASVALKGAAVDDGRTRWLPMMLYAFPLGVGLAVLEHVLPRHVAAAPLRLRRLASPVLWTAGALALVACEVWLESRSYALETAGIAVAAASFVAAPLVRQWAQLPANRLLAHPVSAWLGSRSLSFYLLHFMVQVAVIDVVVEVGDPVWGTLALAVVSVALAAVAAELSFRLVEAPSMQLRRHLDRRMVPFFGARRAPVVAPAVAPSAAVEGALETAER